MIIIYIIILAIIIIISLVLKINEDKEIFIADTLRKKKISCNLENLSLKLNKLYYDKKKNKNVYPKCYKKFLINGNGFSKYGIYNNDVALVTKIYLKRKCKYLERVLLNRFVIIQNNNLAFNVNKTLLKYGDFRLHKIIKIIPSNSDIEWWLDLLLSRYDEYRNLPAILRLQFRHKLIHKFNRVSACFPKEKYFILTLSNHSFHAKYTFHPLSSIYGKVEYILTPEKKIARLYLK